jgi:glutamate-1-semialdehyde 2,1-aminomutase
MMESTLQRQGEESVGVGEVQPAHGAESTSGETTVIDLTPAPNSRSLVRSHELFDRARKVIPGCAQTFSKGYTQYVQGVAPIFLARGRGSYVWDVDGTRYLDLVQGLLPNILGYADEGVNRIVTEQLAHGHSFSMPHPAEVELAEKLVEIIPCAEMVRFGRNGSDATAAAVRCARAYTGREIVACCGYHGWQDWYIGSTVRHRGVPQAVRDLTQPFVYNDLASLEEIFSRHSDNVACVIMEPTNFTEPVSGFLEGVRDLTRKYGALLVFDEICSGFHFGLGGAQKLFGITPDLACFGKAMGNGFPISAIVGSAEIMPVFEDIFVSFTFAGEVSAMAASLEVIRRLQSEPIITEMGRRGTMIQQSIRAFAQAAGIEKNVVTLGRPQWFITKFYDSKGVESIALKSLFQQEFLKRGILTLGTHNLNATLSDADVEHVVAAYREVMPILADAIMNDDIEKRLQGSMIEVIFKVR